MARHLVMHTSLKHEDDILKTPLLEVGTWKYFKLRVQFWKWHKHRTMGRPVLILWRDPRESHKEKQL